MLSIGSDPEVMLVDRDGNLRSAIGIVNGTKEKKIDLGNGNRMFYDNVLLEMNIEAGHDAEDLVEKVRDCLSRVARKIYPSVMQMRSSATYPKSECQHPEARVFGCDPEYCAYDMSQLNPPICEEGNTFRSAGGHIHLGYSREEYPLMASIKDKGTEEEDRSDRDWGRVWVVRMMDLFVGIPSLLIDHDPSSAERRRLYGRAGSHRPKEQYGVEYRSLSNFWLRTPALVRLIYNLSDFVVDFVAKRRHYELWEQGNAESVCKAYNVNELRQTIDNSDIKMAKLLMENLVKKYMPQHLFTEIFQLSEPVQYNVYSEWGI